MTADNCGTQTPSTSRRCTFRFAGDGRIAERWGVRDDAGMMRQIHAMAS